MRLKVNHDSITENIFLIRNKQQTGFNASIEINGKEINLYHYLVHRMFYENILELNANEFDNLKKTLELEKDIINSFSSFLSWGQYEQDLFSFQALKVIERNFSSQERLIDLLEMAKQIPDFLDESERSNVNEFLNEIYLQIELRNKNNQIKYTYVYLMMDETTSAFKIGKSNNPTIRESTLFSEKPHITLLQAWWTDEKEEKKLHAMFKDKRIRGEWFKLTIEDLELIKNRFSDCKVFK